MQPQQVDKRIKVLAGLMALISFAGFVDAAYLAVKWYSGDVIPCTIFESCDLVTKSIYGSIAGIPISLFGALYYLIVLFALVYFFDKKSVKTLRAASWFTTVGFITSLILVSIMAFVLKAGCIYCVVSATTSTLLFATAMVVIRSTRNTPAVQ